MLGVKAPCFQQNEVFIFTVWSIFPDCFIAHLALEKSLSKSFSVYSWIQAVIYTQTTYLTTDMNDQQSQPEVSLSVSSGTTVLVPVGVWLELEGALPKKELIITNRVRFLIILD